jgi:hypothetical protein
MRKGIKTLYFGAAGQTLILEFSGLATYYALHRQLNCAFDA